MPMVLWASLKVRCAIGHNLGTNVDKIFLSMHPMVISFATENLKHMISTSTVALESVREKMKMQAMVPDIEYRTYRFFLIPKEVEQLSYFMRLNGTSFHSFFLKILIILRCILLCDVLLFIYLFISCTRCIESE